MSRLGGDEQQFDNIKVSNFSLCVPNTDQTNCHTQERLEIPKTIILILRIRLDTIYFVKTKN